MDALPITASKPEVKATPRVPSLAKPDLFRALLAESTAQQEIAEPARRETHPRSEESPPERDASAPPPRRERAEAAEARDESRRAPASHPSDAEPEARAAAAANDDPSDTADAADKPDSRDAEAADTPADDATAADEPAQADETAQAGDAAPAEAKQDSTAGETQADDATQGAQATQGAPVGLPQQAQAQVAAVALTQAQAFANQAGKATPTPGADLPETAAEPACVATAAATDGNQPESATAKAGGPAAAAQPAADTGSANTAAPTPLAAAAPGQAKVAGADATAASGPDRAADRANAGKAPDPAGPQPKASAAAPTAGDAQHGKGHGDGLPGNGTTPNAHPATAQASGGAATPRAETAQAAFARALEATRAGEPPSQSGPTTPAANSVPSAGAPGAPGTTAASARLATNAQTPPQTAHSPLPGEQLAIRIQRAAGLGQDHIRIRLHPAELGQVDVRLHVASDGSVKAAITTDRADTLDLLQRDARGLERALQGAGLKTESGSLNFSLRDGGQHGLAGQRHEAGIFGGTPLPGDAGPELEFEPEIAAGRFMTSHRALDITV